MQSLSNVIKRTNVIDFGNKDVITLYRSNVIEETAEPDIVTEAQDSALEDTYKAAEEIIEKSKIEAERAYKKAYEKGYKEGCKKGTEDAAIEAKKHNEAAMDKIEALYNKAVSDYNKYLKEKENSVKKLIAETAKKVLKRELDFTDSINDIIIEALNQEQGRKVIVRCNEKYCNSLRNSVDNWKRETGSNLDVFIIEDITINENSVILVKEEGRAILDIDKAIENIGKIILGES
jgi:flagellar assembly protein FliH